MSNPPFAASKAVTFDLSRGQIQKDGGEPRLLVSANALVALCREGGAEATLTFARAMGEAVGSAIAGRFERSGGDAKGAPLEAIAEHMAGELALAGLGRLSIERWGRALVLVIDHGPANDAGDYLLAPLLAALVSAAAKTEARCVRLGRDGARARFLVTGQRGAEKMREWLSGGVPWGEALVRLHPASTRAGEA